MPSLEQPSGTKRFVHSSRCAQFLWKWKCQYIENITCKTGFRNCQPCKAKLLSVTTSYRFLTDYTCTSAAGTLDVIQGNFLSRKAFWSSYLCDGIMCTKIRVQIWIKPLSEICGFLAVKGEHNRILAHMPRTSVRSSAGCQHQSVHHSLPTPFHNTEQIKPHSTGMSPTNQYRASKSKCSRRMKCPHWLAAAPVPIDTWEISSRWHWWCITPVAERQLMTFCRLGQHSPEQLRPGGQRQTRSGRPPSRSSSCSSKWPQAISRETELDLIHASQPLQYDPFSFDLEKSH